MRIRVSIAVGAIALISALVAVESAMAVDLIGYLPHYRMSSGYVNDTLPDQLAMLDEIRYFGLTVSNSGTIVGLNGGLVSTHLNNINTIKAKIAELPADKKPRLNITLGGAGEATNFATVAASSSLRATFATNIEDLLEDTGAVAVDIDWEHPTNPDQRNNYGLMMQRIKQEVGATKRVMATTSPEIYLPTSTFQGPNAIDGVSVMTYDLGWWGNDPQNPATGEHSMHDYVVDTIDAWTKPPGSPVPVDRDWVFGGTWGNNTAADKVGVGMPFYGRNISNGNAYTFAEMVNGGTTSDGNYYNYSGGSVWIPGPDLVEERVELAYERGLGHIIIWEIAQDVAPDHEKSLLRRAYETKLSLEPVPGDYDGDGSVGASDYELWKSTYGATEGDMRADGNLDGVVDASDYTFWRNLLTESEGSGGLATAVPEPTGVVLAVMGLVVVLFAKRLR